MPGPSARSTMAFLAARCASSETCCHWQPPQAPNSGQAGSTRSAPRRSIETSSAQATRSFACTTRARTRSPGAASGTNVARPSAAVGASAGSRWRPTASPPGASASISTQISGPKLMGGPLRKRLGRAAAVEIEVELAVERAADALVGDAHAYLDGVLDRLVAVDEVERRVEALAEVDLEVALDGRAHGRRSGLDRRAEVLELDPAPGQCDRDGARLDAGVERRQ